MTYTKSAFFLALTFALTGCAAATDNVETLATIDEAHAVDTKSVSHAEKHRHHATVKPGASVTLNSVLPKSMASGSFQTVQLRFDEAYDSGPLSIKIETTDGLSLFGGASSKTFDMNDSNEHVWDVDVKSDVDGVYFLNVFAEAGGQARVFSVRLDMGKTTQKMFDDAMPAGGELIEGGAIRVMDATETIK